MNPIKEFLFDVVFPILGGCAFLVVLMSPLMYFLYLGHSKACSVKGEHYQMEAEYNFWGGCLYKLDGRPIPADKVMIYLEEKQ